MIMAMVTLQSAAERDAAHAAASGEKKDPFAGMTLLTAEGQQPRAKAAIEITKNALKRIRAAMAKEGVSPEQGGLRVGIQGGGCSGLRYNIRFDSQPRERDRVYDFDGVRVFVDPKSFIYLHGMVLDYEGRVLMKGFACGIQNSSKCGGDV